METIFLLLVFVHVFTSTLCNYNLIKENKALKDSYAFLDALYTVALEALDTDRSE